MEQVLWKMRKGFLVAWFTFCCVIFIFSLVIYFNLDESAHSKHQVKNYKRMKFSTLLDNEIATFNATWVSDEEILTQDDSGNIILFDVNKSIKSILAFSSMQHVKNCHKYELSADKKYLLVGYNKDEETSSGLSSANYDVITVKTGKQVTLRDTHGKQRYIMAAKWSPVESSLIIVDNYDIYYILSAAKPNHVKQLTFHGSEDLFHGIPDWVYREEIFSSDIAMWFSAKGTQLAYARFNETSVPSAHLQKYGIPDTMYDQFSSISSYHYPKVNDVNPTVELFVQNLNVTSELEYKPIQIKPTITYATETILSHVTWSDDEHLFAMWTNRVQTESHLVHYHISNDEPEVIEVMEFQQENGWVDFRGSLLVSPDHRVVLVYPNELENLDSYRHIHFIETDGRSTPITCGKYEVTCLVKWDFKNEELYFFANTELSSEKQDLYKVSTKDPQEPHCVTCGTGCDFSRADLSQDFTYYAHTCAGPGVPYINILTTKGDFITLWESNKKLSIVLEDVPMPRIEFLTVPLADGYDARVKLLIPPSVNAKTGNEYPLLIYTYGGPTFNLVLNDFKINLSVYLCINHDFVVAEVDGRGTGRRGSKILFANYKKLGTEEIDDQIAIVKYLKDQFPFLNESRTGIWGWSFGGYIAGMALARDEENVFDCALSVAPVTDWIYYDSLFAERLMGKYEDNVEAYRNSSLIERVDGLRRKKFMIIHGMSDTNVHFQHSAMLSKELHQKGIMFRQQFYPDESHKFQKFKNHLYRSIISFLLNYLT